MTRCRIFFIYTVVTFWILKKKEKKKIQAKGLYRYSSVFANPYTPSSYPLPLSLSTLFYIFFFFRLMVGQTLSIFSPNTAKDRRPCTFPSRPPPMSTHVIIFLPMSSFFLSSRLEPPPRRKSALQMQQLVAHKHDGTFLTLSVRSRR